MNRHASADRIEQTAACWFVRCEPLQRLEWQRMMRDDQIDTLADGFSRRLRRNRETSHHALDFLRLVANKQADVVPFSRQLSRGKNLEKITNVPNGGHGTSFGAVTWLIEGAEIS